MLSTTKIGCTKISQSLYAHRLAFDVSVVRASVPKLSLDKVFEQKNEIAKAVEEELEKASFNFESA